MTKNIKVGFTTVKCKIYNRDALSAIKLKNILMKGENAIFYWKKGYKDNYFYKVDGFINGVSLEMLGCEGFSDYSPREAIDMLLDDIYCLKEI